MPTVKIKLGYSLQQPIVPNVKSAHSVIPLPIDQQKEIGQVFLDAYRDTIDYEGESLDEAMHEVSRVFNGEYGSLILSASGAILVEGNIAAAVFVCEQNETPFIPYILTSKEWKGHGMASELLRHALSQLSKEGYHRVELYVTKGNQAAENLYKKFGFYAVE